MNENELIKEFNEGYRNGYDQAVSQVGDALYLAVKTMANQTGVYYGQRKYDCITGINRTPEGKYMAVLYCKNSDTYAMVYIDYIDF